jgi:hypothetical protein
MRKIWMIIACLMFAGALAFGQPEGATAKALSSQVPSWAKTLFGGGQAEQHVVEVVGSGAHTYFIRNADGSQAYVQIDGVNCCTLGLGYPCDGKHHRHPKPDEAKIRKAVEVANR